MHTGYTITLHSIAAAPTHPKYDMLGWYSTGAEVQPDDLEQLTLDRQGGHPLGVSEINMQALSIGSSDSY